MCDKCELQARSKNVAQSTKITSPLSVSLSAAPFVGFCVLKVIRDLRALERVASFRFEVWSDIQKSMKEIEKIRAHEKGIEPKCTEFLWDCCWHVRLWRGARHWCIYGWNRWGLIFWLLLTLSHFQPFSLALWFVGLYVYFTKFHSQ